MDHNTNQPQPTTSRAAKLDYIREKIEEMKTSNQIKTQSAQMALYLEELGDQVQMVSEGSRSAANVYGNWAQVFRTMGVMNNESGPYASNPTIINLPRRNNDTDIP
ncbi:hypothetical protein BC941DRAFT_467049 [Chlamydoabsidia padenii]|nr:hypothetical protein BC941DRAFT_467049 [Chlamydoabsidia padenii]